MIMSLNISKNIFCTNFILYLSIQGMGMEVPQETQQKFQEDETDVNGDGGQFPGV